MLSPVLFTLSNNEKCFCLKSCLFYTWTKCSAPPPVLLVSVIIKPCCCLGWHENVITDKAEEDSFVLSQPYWLLDYLMCLLTLYMCWELGQSRKLIQLSRGFDQMWLTGQMAAPRPGSRLWFGSLHHPHVLVLVWKLSFTLTCFWMNLLVPRSLLG